MKRTYERNVDLFYKKRVEPFSVKQGDKLTTEIKLNISLEGAPIDLTDKEVDFVFEKSNGKIVFQSSRDDTGP